MSHVDRRHQILEVSLTAFSSRGYHNTSMNDIADAMSLTKPVLYQYFDSKRSLYLELLRHVGEQLLEDVTAAVKGTTDPREQTERGIIAYFRIMNGTLKKGDIFVVGEQWGKVRALINDKGETITEAGPSV